MYCLITLGKGFIKAMVIKKNLLCPKKKTMKRFLLSFSMITLCCTVMSSQCYIERHGMKYSDAWISCETAMTPNPNIPEAAHWIMYDLGVVDTFYNIKVWNYNHWEDSDYGISSFSLSISNDGVDWQIVDTFSLDQAPASAFYEGETVSNLIGVTGRYVLITGLENYGGDCFALSEIRIDLEDNSICNDKIAIEVVLSPNIIGSSNDIVLVTIVVVNVGDETLNGIELNVEESLFSGEAYTTTLNPTLQGDPNGNGRLDVGEVWFYTAVKSYDYDEGDVFIVSAGVSGLGEACQAVAGNAKLLFTTFNPNALMPDDLQVEYREALNNYDAGINLYPNPVISGTPLTFETDPILGTNYMIVNSGGQVVKNISLSSGQKISNINTEDLTAGLYFIVPEGNIENKDYPFIIKR